MAFEFNLKLFFVKIIFLFLFIFQSEVIASSKLDCKEKAFYITDVISEAKHKDLTKAKFNAEENGRLIAFNQLLNRLAFRKQIKNSYDQENLIKQWMHQWQLPLVSSEFGMQVHRSFQVSWDLYEDIHEDLQVELRSWEHLAVRWAWSELAVRPTI